MINFAFLDFVKSWLSDGLEKVGGAIIQGIRYLMFSLSALIYELFMNLYDMFTALCTVRLLSNDILQELANRVGYILGVVMLFYVILGFIQLLLNPDAINDKEKGAVSIIKKTIIVIIMLGTANFAFELLYQVQNTVINSNIISRILLPYAITTSVNGQDSGDTESSVMQNEKFASIFAEELFSSFYGIEDFDEDDIDSSGDISSYNNCQTVVNNFRNQIINNRSFDLGYTCLNSTIVVNFKIDSSTKSESQETNVVRFNYLLCPIFGLVAVYLMFSYCIKVGVRMVQLMFLEIISPMAIVSYLAPKKDTMFSKWQKIYISTYVDVFVRIAIINFSFFLISTVFSTTGGKGLEFQGTDWSSNLFFKAFIIISIMIFAKKVPDLLKELLPQSASKLGFAPSAKELFENSYLSATVGAATGSAVGLLHGKPLSGAVHGAFNGSNAKNVIDSIKNSYNKQSELNKSGGFIRKYINSHEDEAIAKAQEKVNLYKTANDEATSEAVKNGSNYIIHSATAGGTVSLAQLEKLKDDQSLDYATRTNYQSDYDKLKKSAAMFNLDYGRAAEGNTSVEFNDDGDFVSMMGGSSGNVYTSLDAVNQIADKDSEIGGRNVTIDTNMNVLAGSATSGRGNEAKKIRNSNSNYITNATSNTKYRNRKRKY